MLLRVIPHRVFVWLTFCLLLLLAANLLAAWLEFGLGYTYVYGFVPLFYFGMEGNVPTLFATALLFGNGLLLLALSALSREGARERRVWLVLAGAFLFLAVDEATMIHERLIDPVRALVDAGGVLYFAWVIPYAVLAALLGLYCAPVILRLEPRFVVLFGASAAIYLMGAIGVEMLGGRYFESVGEVIDLRYRLYQTVEETLEFAGLIVFVHALLTLIASRWRRIDLQLQFGPINGGGRRKGSA